MTFGVHKKRYVVVGRRGNGYAPTIEANKNVHDMAVFICFTVPRGGGSPFAVHSESNDKIRRSKAIVICI